MTHHANRLIHETSPYLLQHAHNPVDWYPWGEEALRRAGEEDKPILLSIGYAACHWCHVMERESFEDEETARIMNAHFISIKVDREERPDLDAVYMDAVQAMTGHGGWPMTVFLTPEGIPFYGGTYYPPEPRHGLPAFRDLLIGVAEAYRERKEEIQQTGETLVEHLNRSRLIAPENVDLEPSLLDRAIGALETTYDATHGGFGTAPKFPPAHALEFLLRSHLRTGSLRALQMAERTLEKMARGGIYDQLGGGFHRYSVDRMWLVPHFEKMLYDNALLARVYLHAYQVTGKALYRRVVEETLDYVLREMTHPDGGFFATQDADSEGEEGKYYVWTPDEVVEVLGETDGDIFSQYYDVTGGGNFEGKNILHLPKDQDVVAHLCKISDKRLKKVIARSRQKMLAHRGGRVAPGRDEKVLVGWNGLMLSALSEAARVLGREDYRAAAQGNARFLLGNLFEDGRLLHTWKDGQRKVKGFLEDHAFLADGLLELYQTDFDPAWFDSAAKLVQAMVELFWDEEVGGFFQTGKDQEALITRPKEFSDGATPSGNSVAAEVLLRWTAYTGETEYERRAEEILRLIAQSAARHPTGFGRALSALDLQLATPQEIAIVGPREQDGTRSLVNIVARRYLPNSVVALGEPDDGRVREAIPLLADRPMTGGKPTAYVCQRFLCKAPVTDPEDLAQQLGSDGAYEPRIQEKEPA